MATNKDKTKPKSIIYNNDNADHIVTLASGTEILIPSRSQVTVLTSEVPTNLPRVLVVKNL